MLAVETGYILPDLLSVIDLGANRTGIIVSDLRFYESAWLRLVVYRDGADLDHMLALQSIGAGE